MLQGDARIFAFIMYEEFARDLLCEVYRCPSLCIALPCLKYRQEPKKHCACLHLSVVLTGTWFISLH